MMIKDIEVNLNKDVDNSDNDYVRESLIKSNLNKMPTKQNPSPEMYNLIIKSNQGVIIGGILGLMDRYCYYIDKLWVDERYRGQGLGRKLIDDIEIILKKKGCKLMCVDTFGFQAPEFYKKMGFETFGILDGYPEKIELLYMKKTIE